MLDNANADGGWAYYAGKGSRLEPTCWAVLALADGAVSPGSGFFARWQQSHGWLVEDSRWPVNIGFNALAAFTSWHHRDLATDDMRRRLLAALVASKGIQAPPLEGSGQNNSLRGWSWTDGTFSWVEPTCWGLLALKAARQAGAADAAAAARIVEAERLLIDRTCAAGGWNFGNAMMMQQDLRPYVPTTALGLLAMQDRRGEPAVLRSLAFLEERWADEVSASAMGLSLICLSVYGRPVDGIVTRLREHADETRALGNLHAAAVALFALTKAGQANAFRL